MDSFRVFTNMESREYQQKYEQNTSRVAQGTADDDMNEGKIQL